MTASSFQMERLLDRLRQAREWLPWPAYRSRRVSDPVRMSPAAEQAAESLRAQGVSAPAPLSMAAVRDLRQYAPAVEEERERRAGSFMEPPFPETPPPGHIPKRPRTAAPRRRPRPAGDAD